MSKDCSRGNRLDSFANGNRRLGGHPLLALAAALVLLALPVKAFSDAWYNSSWSTDRTFWFQETPPAGISRIFPFSSISIAPTTPKCSVWPRAIFTTWYSRTMTALPCFPMKSKALRRPISLFGSSWRIITLLLVRWAATITSSFTMETQLPAINRTRRRCGMPIISLSTI